MTTQQSNPGSSELRIGDCVVRPQSGSVVRPDGEHRLEPRVMQVLVTLSKRLAANRIIEGSVSLEGENVRVTVQSIDASAAALPAPLVWDNSQLYVTGELVVGVQSIADGDLHPWDNPDGQLTVADLLMAQQILIGIRSAGALQFAHGDMDADGLFSVADLLLIEQAVQ